jgi:hypothetical protein
MTGFTAWSVSDSGHSVKRQADRDRVFAEREPAREYVTALLKSDTPTEKLAEVVKADESLGALRKLVVLEELEWEVKRREAEKDRHAAPASTKPSAPTTRPTTRP